MNLQITFRGEEMVEFKDFDAEMYEDFRRQLNNGKLEFIAYTGPDGRKHLVNKQNILMTTLYSEV